MPLPSILFSTNSMPRVRHELAVKRTVSQMPVVQFSPVKLYYKPDYADAYLTVP